MKNTEDAKSGSLKQPSCATPDPVRETAQLIVRVAKRRAMKPEYMADIVAKLCAGTVRERARRNAGDERLPANNPKI